MTSQGKTSPTLTATDVSFSYRNRLVIQGLSLTLQPGEFLGLAGPNGSGKTTLLKLLTGYHKPGSGAVQLGGRDLHELTRNDVAGAIALVPQAASTAFPYRVDELVRKARFRYASVGGSDLGVAEDEVVRHALEQVGISEFAGRRYDQLSGGEQRLVLIARALAQQTPILLLDEPLAALDLQHQWHVLKLVQTLRAGGATVLATFHDLNVAARWCSRVALLHRGSIAAIGKAEAVFQAERLEQVYGLPLRVRGVAGGEAEGRVEVDLPLP